MLHLLAALPPTLIINLSAPNVFAMVVVMNVIDVVLLFVAGKGVVRMGGGDDDSYNLLHVQNAVYCPLSKICSPLYTLIRLQK